MLNKEIEAALNAQVNAEMWSAYLYLSMSAYCHEHGNSGMANWFAIQFKEEQDHAMMFFNHVIARGGRITLAPIAEVQTSWQSPLEAFENTLAHEQKVTEMINNLYALADTHKDYATQSMLRWFIDEQVEEEETAQEIIKNLRMVQDNGFGMFMIDKELGARVYTAPQHDEY